MCGRLSTSKGILANPENPGLGFPLDQASAHVKLAWEHSRVEAKALGALALLSSKLQPLERRNTFCWDYRPNREAGSVVLRCDSRL